MHLRGRNGELKWLLSALDLEARAQGSVRLLLGPSGVGKSRLVSEAATVGAARGFRVLSAQSHPFDRDLAYTPFLHMLVPYLKSLAPSERAALTMGLNPLGQVLTDIGLDPPHQLGNAAIQKTRLFEAVTGLCTRLATGKPLMLVFDDLQFADSNSIALFAYLARAFRDVPVVLLATCNTEHVDEAPKLLSTIRSLARSRLCETLDVEPLDSGDLTLIVSDLLEGEPPPALLRILQSRVGGIPLFALEWTQGLIETGHLFRRHGAWVLASDLPHEVPPRVQDVILERLNRLSPESRAVLDLIAVNGGEMDHALLLSVAAKSATDLDSVLSELVRGHLLTEHFTENRLVLGVSHPLMAQVTYRSLPAVQRQRCHLAIIDSLENQPEDRGLPLAFHYRASGAAIGSPRALEVLIAAGEREAELHANSEAAGYFRCALDLVRAGVPSERSHVLPWLLSRLAQAQERSGAHEEAAQYRAEAIELYQRAGRMTRIADLRLRSAMAEWARGRHGVAWAHLQAGIGALEGVGVSPEHVTLHHAEVMLLARLGRREGMGAAVQAACAAAERLGAPPLTALAHLAELVHLFDARELGHSRFPRLRHAIERVEATGEEEAIHRAYVLGAVAGMSLGFHREAHDYARRAMETGARLGAPAMEAFGLSLLVAANLYLGHWDEADRLGARLVALDRRIGIPRGTAIALSSWAMVLARRGETVAAEACLAEAQEVYGDGLATDVHTMASLRVAQTTLALEGGRAQAAPFGPADLPSELHVTLFAQRMGGIAEMLIGRGDISTARRVLAHLGDGDSPLAEAMAARVRALLFRHDGDVAKAIECFGAAATEFERLEMPLEAAEARLDRVELVGDGPAVANEVADLLVFFRRLGSPRLLARAARLAGPAASAPEAAEPEPGPADRSLTPRQWEIAGLVALGLTNGEIAKRLVISVRTVTTHLSHIFNNLDLNSRTALARYVMAYEQETGKGA